VVLCLLCILCGAEGLPPIPTRPLHPQKTFVCESGTQCGCVSALVFMFLVQHMGMGWSHCRSPYFPLESLGDDVIYLHCFPRWYDTLFTGKFFAVDHITMEGGLMIYLYGTGRMHRISISLLSLSLSLCVCVCVCVCVLCVHFCICMVSFPKGAYSLCNLCLQ